MLTSIFHFLIISNAVFCLSTMGFYFSFVFSFLCLLQHHICFMKCSSISQTLCVFLLPSSELVSSQHTHLLLTEAAHVSWILKMEKSFLISTQYLTQMGIFFKIYAIFAQYSLLHLCLMELLVLHALFSSSITVCKVLLL